MPMKSVYHSSENKEKPEKKVLKIIIKRIARGLWTSSEQFSEHRPWSGNSLLILNFIKSDCRKANPSLSIIGNQSVVRSQYNA